MIPNHVNQIEGFAWESVMNNNFRAYVAFLASVLMIFFTYWGCQRILKSAADFPKWESRNNCRIIHKEYSMFWRRGWHRVMVEDSSGNRQSAWVRFSFFTGKDTTVWD